MPREEWIITENAHEAIISKEMFDQEQSVIRHNQRSQIPRKPFQLFRGIIKCSYCGRTLTRSDCKQPFFHCTSKRTLPGIPCAEIQLIENTLQKNVLTALQTQIPLMLPKKEEQTPQHNHLQGTIQKCQATINYYKTLQTTAFEDYADGCISKQEYLTRK